MANCQVGPAAAVLELYAGCARWLRWSHAGVSLLAMAGILGSGAAPAWSAAAVIALVAVHAGTARSMSGSATSGRLRLFADGSAVLFAAAAPVALSRTDGGWVSRWFCVLPLLRRDSGRRLHLIVCRSLNTPDAYRRLLVRLRLGPADEADRDLRWS